MRRATGIGWGLFGALVCASGCSDDGADTGSTSMNGSTGVASTDAGTTGSPTKGATTGGSTTGMSSTTGEAPVCGDGNVDPGEECDDGALNGDMNGCKSDCTHNVCGDGAVGPGEACDDGNQADNDDCTNACALASCGDGITAMTEECDDGNADNTDACTDVCMLPKCGDLFVQPSNMEECDDGNADNTDACVSTCKLPKCGDGFVKPGVEQCDDGNVEPGDGCSASCLITCDPGTSNVLANPSFETGSLAPWTSNTNAKLVDTATHGGMWAAQIFGIFYIHQDFAAVPVNKLVIADFWSYFNVADITGVITAEWGYSDKTTGKADFVYNVPWKQHSILDKLDVGKSLVYLRVYGSGKLPGKESRFDDFRLCRAP